LSVGLSELDRVLGGGLVSGSVILLGGDPGIGKSTLLIQTLAQLRGTRSLYVTGEESLTQVVLRIRRLELPEEHLRLVMETHLDAILAAADREQPSVIVVDSVQTLYRDDLHSAPGSVPQVRESTAELVRYAKQTGRTVILVGHVTKEGAIAGPRVLEHMVDTVLYFEGESGSRLRVIRAIKNRFGTINELGVFAMSERGLKPVSNPSALFLTRHGRAAGAAVTVMQEGTRPLLVEVQALVEESALAQPRRVAVGFDGNRLNLLLAVLHRHGGVRLYGQDVFVNVVGGLRLTETAVDLGILYAILSSFRDRPLEAGVFGFGEIGLTGELRPVPNGPERLREAAKHGFQRAIVPRGNAPKASQTPSGLEVVPVTSIGEALEAAI
jgi:DNA repair protein RadA/Sms